MVDFEELRIGNLLEYQRKLACVVELELEGNSLKIQCRINEKHMTEATLKANNAELKQINLSKAIIEAMGLAKMKEGYCLPKANATRMLCEGEEGYYIGLSNTDRSQSPIHLTKEFTGFHYLQNAYYFIYGKEMPNFADEIWRCCYR